MVLIYPEKGLIDQLYRLLRLSFLYLPLEEGSDQRGAPAIMTVSLRKTHCLSFLDPVLPPELPP